MLARLTALAVAFALTSCVTAENSLTQNDIATMKLTGVTVSYAPNAMVQWEEGMRAYATAKAIPEEQIPTAAYAPEGRAYVQNMLAPHIKAGIERAMAGQLNGARPVRLNVTVRSFQIASAAQAILIANDRSMIADVDLVDARTGAVIIANPKLSVALPAPSGLIGAAVQAAFDSSNDQSVTTRIVDAYGREYRRWLLRETS